MLPDFIHLNVRSAYSLCQSMLTPEKIAALCRNYNMPAVGVADLDNMFGALGLSESLAKHGIHGIVGLSVTVDFADGRPPGRMNFYAMDEHGYRNLMAIASIAMGVGHAA